MRISDLRYEGVITDELRSHPLRHSPWLPVCKEQTSVDILGVHLHPLSRRMLTTKFSQLLHQRQRGWISYINIHAVHLAHQLTWFADYLNNSLLTYCDGQGVRFGGWIVGKNIPERIVMADWIHDVFSICQEAGCSVFLLGSSPTVIETAVRRISSWYPKLTIAGYHHGYFSDDGKALLSSIQAVHPDVIVVGMGMPLQEQWILNNYTKAGARIFLNGGSCFEYLSGIKWRCPGWMGRAGCEWLIRLSQEPRRLWKRYLIGNPWFLISLLKSMFR
ncbi:MAG: WecB/TagA/CpsF family glycosyltransferase [bacterium]